MLKFHPYSILTGDTRVEFVIYCLLSNLPVIKRNDNDKLAMTKENYHIGVHWKEHNDQKMFHCLFQSKILKSLLKVA